MGLNESKIGYFSHLSRLLSEDIPETELEYWLNIWKISDDIFLFLTPTFVRSLIKQRKGNLERLLRVAVSLLESFVTEAHNNNNKNNNNLPIEAILNMIRTFTRITPFIYETYNIAFIYTLFWSDSNGENSLGSRLVNVLLNLSFIPGFSIVSKHKELDSPELEPLSEGLEPSIVWNVMEKVENSKMNTYRLELLRCLLVCGSQTLYTQSEYSKVTRNEFLEKLIHPNTPHNITLCYSLINVIFTYDPIGWGIPYSSSVVGDSTLSVVNTSAQLLALLLDYNPIPLNKEKRQREYPDFSNNLNSIQEALSTLSEPSAFVTIFDGLSELLSTVYQSQNTWMPKSQTHVHCYQELLIIFLKLIEINQDFLKFIAIQSNIHDLLIPIFYLMFTSYENSSRTGLIYLSSFIIFYLTCENNISIQFNQKCQVSLPIKIQTKNIILTDLYISLLTDTIKNDSCSYYTRYALYENLFKILVNLSFNIESISMNSAEKLINLFEETTTFEFLFSSPSNKNIVFLLFDSLNKILRNQKFGDSPLIYFLIKKKNIFDRLLNLPEYFLNQAKIRQHLDVSKELDNQSKAYLIDQEISIEYEKIKKLRQKKSTSTQDSNQNDNEENKENSTQNENLNNTTTTNSVSGKNNLIDQNWKPSIVWLEQWIKELPIETIQSIFTLLIPRVQKYLSKKKFDEQKIFEILSKVSISETFGPKIQLYKPHPSQLNNHWLTTFLWAVIYLENVSLAFFDNKTVQLFEFE